MTEKEKVEGHICRQQSRNRQAEANEDKGSEDRTGFPDQKFLTEAAFSEALLIPSPSDFQGLVSNHRCGNTGLKSVLENWTILEETFKA